MSRGAGMMHESWTGVCLCAQCPEVTVRICRMRVREWLVRIRSFSMESESRAICEPSNQLLPRLHPLSTSACSSGTLGVTEPGEKWSPPGEGISLLLGQRERSKEQTRGGRGCVRLCFCRSSLGAGQSTAPLQTFIRVHRVNWNIPAPTALIHSDSFRSFW